jgi:hypothetical protein
LIYFDLVLGVPPQKKYRIAVFFLRRRVLRGFSTSACRRRTARQSRAPLHPLTRRAFGALLGAKKRLKYATPPLSDKSEA